MRPPSGSRSEKNRNEFRRSRPTLWFQRVASRPAPLALVALSRRQSLQRGEQLPPPCDGGKQRRQGNPPTGCATLRVQQSLMGETPKTAPHFPGTSSGKQRRARNTGTRSGMLFLRAQRCFTCYNALVPAQRSGLPQRAALGTRKGALDSPRRRKASPRRLGKPEAFMTDAQGNAHQDRERGKSCTLFV